jgi:hypothetical protein
MTAFITIGLAACIKAILTHWMGKKGWWPDWEKRALRREEHKRVIKAYEKWCSETGERPAADHIALQKLELRRARGQ